MSVNPAKDGRCLALFQTDIFSMHPGLSYNKQGALHFAKQDLTLLAERYGTPLYVYSADLITSALAALRKAFAQAGREALICYSVKANSNLSILQLLQEAGCGADIVSGGELYRAAKAQFHPKRIIFSGTGKSLEELEEAVELGILLFSVESEEELFLLHELGLQRKQQIPVSLRINPALEAATHPYIATGRKHDKFGIALENIEALYKEAVQMPGLAPAGLGLHIGSQILESSAFASASHIVGELARRIKGRQWPLSYIDLGGGLGICYQNEKPPTWEDYVQAVLPGLTGLEDCQLLLEPGRSIVGNAGILLGKILGVKTNSAKSFYIGDVAMSDLIRPSLYKAYHAILPCKEGAAIGPNADLVGPVCETGDFMAQDRALPLFKKGDYFALCSAGAYGFVMASNYNSRPKAAELLIDKNGARLIRKRESYADLVAKEEPLLAKGQSKGELYT